MFNNSPLHPIRKLMSQIYIVKNILNKYKTHSNKQLHTYIHTYMKTGVS